MLRVEESVEINRPVEEVFDYVSTVENFPEWAGPPIEVRREEGSGPVREGERFTYVSKFLGRQYETPSEVTAYEPNRRLSYRATGGPIPDQNWTHTFEETPTGTTRYTQVVEGEPGGFFRLAGPLLERAGRRQFRADLGTLKDMLEAEQG